MPQDTIQVIPPGLLGLLQLKTGGQNPDRLLTTVQPTFDLELLYLQARALDWFTDRGGNDSPEVSRTTGQRGSIGLATNPGGIAPVVGAREAWFVHEFSLQAVLGAGDALSMDPVWFNTAPAQPAYNLGTGAASNIAPKGGAAVVGAAARNFWLPPGAQLGVMVYDVTAAVSVVISGAIRFTPLPL